MLFRRNSENDDPLDYDVPMEGEPDNASDERPARTYGFNPQAKINAMQKVINALNENIGSLKGQLTGYKVLRGKYDTILREKVELEYKVKELGMTVDQLNKVLEGQRDKKNEDLEMLGYALRMHPDFLEWYTKEKAKNTVNSYEAQIEILKAKIATMRKDT